MKRLVSMLALAGMVLAGSTIIASAQEIVDQQHAFGTLTRGSTVCVGPLSPSGSQGVQIFGFTNGQSSLIWQVFAVSSQSAPVLVFSTTARSVDQTVPPSGNFLFQACVVKNTIPKQDFDLSLNSSPVE